MNKPLLLVPFLLVGCSSVNELVPVPDRTHAMTIAQSAKGQFLLCEACGKPTPKTIQIVEPQAPRYAPTQLPAASAQARPGAANSTPSQPAEQPAKAVQLVDASEKLRFKVGKTPIGKQHEAQILAVIDSKPQKVVIRSCAGRHGKVRVKAIQDRLGKEGIAAEVEFRTCKPARNKGKGFTYLTINYAHPQ